MLQTHLQYVWLLRSNKARETVPLSFLVNILCSSDLSQLSAKFPNGKSLRNILYSRVQYSILENYLVKQGKYIHLILYSLVQYNGKLRSKTGKIYSPHLIVHRVQILEN